MLVVPAHQLRGHLQSASFGISLKHAVDEADAEARALQVPPTCWLYQPTNCAATCRARASASASSTACLTARREARWRTFTATRTSGGGRSTGWLRAAC